MLLLGLVGSGVAVHVGHPRLRAAAVPLAPVFGLALGSAATMTASFLLPGRVSAWLVLLPLAIGSASVAVWRVRKRDAGPAAWRRHRRLTLQTVGVIAVGAVLLSWPLASQRSLGPIGYTLADAAGYTAQISGLKDHALADPTWGEPWNRTVAYAERVADGGQQIGFDTLGSNVAVLFGSTATDIQSALMIVLVLIGAAGVLAAVRGFAGRPTVAAPVAGLLACGPLAFTLFIDGSEGALAGLALLPAAGLVTSAVIEQRRWADVVALGLLFAGVQTTYPYLALTVATSAAILLAGLLVMTIVNGRLGRPVLMKAASTTGAVALIAAVASPVATVRNLDYWLTTASDLLSTPGLPKYDLPLPALPSWLLQTRDFHYLPRSSDSSVGQWFLTDIAPLALIVLVAYGLWRYRAAFVFVPLAIASAAIAYWSLKAHDCSYCLQRGLLPIGGVASTLVGLGIAGITRERRTVLRFLGYGAAAATLAVVGYRAVIVAKRAEGGAYVVPHDARIIARQLAGRDGPVQLELPGASYEGTWQEPSLYHLVNDESRARISISTEPNEYNGLQYLALVPTPNGPPYFDPSYRLVFTRAADIDSGRTVIARAGAYALEKRRSLDTIVLGGVALDLAKMDARGAAWVQGPMSFAVVGARGRGVWLQLSFVGAFTPTVVTPRGARLVRSSPTGFSLCVPAPATSVLRTVNVNLVGFAPALPQAPRGFEAQARPGRSLRLSRAVATTNECRSR